MSLLQNLKNYTRLNKPKNDDQDYLDKLKHIVGLGLSDLYKIKPDNPIRFLANWLYKQSMEYQLLDEIKEHNKQVKKLEDKYIKIKEKEIAYRHIEEEQKQVQKRAPHREKH